MSDEHNCSTVNCQTAQNEAKMGSSSATKTSLGCSEIPTSDWQSSATDRSNWRKVRSNSIHSFEEAHLDSMKIRRQQRKEATSSTINPLRSTCTCNTCTINPLRSTCTCNTGTINPLRSTCTCNTGKCICHLRIGLNAHVKRHR